MVIVLGMRLTCGVVEGSGAVADSDAALIVNLERAGAICLAITNVPEMMFWYEAVNKLYGRTSCAYDSRRTSGGSSGIRISTTQRCYCFTAANSALNSLIKFTSANLSCYASWLDTSFRPRPIQP